jgi:hypothetical protein
VFDGRAGTQEREATMTDREAAMSVTADFLIGLREKCKETDLTNRKIVGVKWEKCKPGRFESPIFLMDDGSWIEFYSSERIGIVFEVREAPYPSWAAAR